MDMDQAAVFLAGSILTALGFVVVAIAVVAINNIVARYWQPVRVFTEDSWHSVGAAPRFAEPQEIAALDKGQGSSSNKK
jgi:hypothetical protein